MEFENAPLLEAAFRLAKAFGWTPQEVQALTTAQMNMYLYFLEKSE